MKVFFSAGLDDYTGANRMTRAYMRGLAAKGDQVMLAHPSESDDGLERTVEPKLSSLLRSEGIATFEVADFPFTISPASIFKLIGLLAKTRPEVVIATFQSDAKIMGPLSVLMRTPFVYFAQNIGEFSGGRLSRVFKRRLWGFLLRESADRIVATSREVADDLMRNHGVAQKLVRVITNAVDLPSVRDRMRTQNLMLEVGAGESTFFILNVGRLDEQKDQLTLIEAAHMLAGDGVDFRLLLVGGVSPTGIEESIAYRERLVARINELGLTGKVFLLGWRNDVGELLTQVDAYVHSARWEGFPLAVLDAWAASIPVVMTDCFHIPGDAVRPGWGRVVPVGDAHGLASAIREIQKNSEGERQKMGVEARRFAETHFDLESRIREMRDCMAYILEARGSGHVI